MDTFVPVDWFNAQMAQNPVQLVEWTAYSFGLGVLFHWKAWPKIASWLGRDRVEPLSADEIRAAVDAADEDELS